MNFFYEFAGTIGKRKFSAGDLFLINCGTLFFRGRFV